VSRIVALVRPVLDPDKLTPETQRTLDRLEGLAGPLMAAPVAH
jgi:hypothetical protein